MKFRTTDRFRARFTLLPNEVNSHARDAFKLIMENPSHLGLRFKKIHPVQPVYLVRVTLDCRAVGVRDGDEMIWFWIGSYDEYERLLNSL